MEVAVAERLSRRMEAAVADGTSPLADEVDSGRAAAADGAAPVVAEGAKMGWPWRTAAPAAGRNGE